VQQTNHASSRWHPRTLLITPNQIALLKSLQARSESCGCIPALNPAGKLSGTDGPVLAHTLKNRLFTIRQVNRLVKDCHSLHVFKTRNVPATAACSMIQLFNADNYASNTKRDGCNDNHVPDGH
jgi:hypothetical protein